MSDTVLQKNVGALIKAVPCVEPQSASAGTLTGASIDRVSHSMALSCVIFTNIGAVSGAPSAQSATSTLQHSSDNSTWTTYQPDGANNATDPSPPTAANSASNFAVDLTLANRYIRVQTVVAFTGGTSPAALVDAPVILGGEQTLAAV